MKRIDERFLISPFFVFFLVLTNMIGLGMLRFQKEIIEGAGYDAWISVIVCGLSIHILVWMIYRIMRITNHDVIHVNQLCFGKWIGGTINIFIIVYFAWLALIVFRSYIEVVQVWMFPLMKTWQISIIFLLLLYYIISSGFRVITGICFWGAVIPFIFLFPLLFFPLEFARFTNLSPVFNHSVKEILISVKSMLFQFIGFETLFLFYPFIKNPEKSHKWAQFSVLFAGCLYLIVTLITFVFYSQEHLKHLIWPTLSLLKIAEIPIIERFEYIVVSMWFLVVLPNISVKIWAACRGIKRIANIKQRISLIVLLLLFFLLSNVLDERRLIKQFSDICSSLYICFVYGYIPLLFLVVEIKRKVMMKKSP